MFLNVYKKVQSVTTDQWQQKQLFEKEKKRFIRHIQRE